VSGGKRLSKLAAKAEPAMDVAVGQRIRDLRRTRAMSLEAVAARTALSPATAARVGGAGLGDGSHLRG